MKVLVNRAALVEALGLASSVVLSRTPKPVLTCVKLVAGEAAAGGGKTLTLIATDMELALQYTLTQVDIATPGVMSMPGIAAPGVMSMPAIASPEAESALAEVAPQPVSASADSAKIPARPRLLDNPSSHRYPVMPS